MKILKVIILIYFVSSYLNAEELVQPVFVSIPDANWAVKLESKNFNLLEYNLTSAGKARFYQSRNDTLGLEVSITIEKAIKTGDNKLVREYYWTLIEKNNTKKSDVKYYESGDFAFTEFTVKKDNTNDINLKTINMYSVKNNNWIQIHILKLNYASVDDSMIKKFISTIKINKDFKMRQTDYLEAGLLWYKSKDFNKCIKYLQQFIDMEISKPESSVDGLRLAVIQLGISYSLVGKQDKAIEVFNYGIKRESNNSSFYYNLACVYAEKKDIDKIISNLKLAYMNQSSIDKAYKMLNPKNDPSFKDYINNTKFKAMLKEFNM